MDKPSVTVFKDEHGIQIAAMYRRDDGHLEVHGLELATFLKGITIGHPPNPPGKQRLADGMGCLAAQVVAHFKTGYGGIYLLPEHASDEWLGYASIR